MKFIRPHKRSRQVHPSISVLLIETTDPFAEEAEPGFVEDADPGFAFFFGDLLRQPTKSSYQESVEFRNVQFSTTNEIKLN